MQPGARTFDSVWPPCGRAQDYTQRLRCAAWRDDDMWPAHQHCMPTCDDSADFCRVCRVEIWIGGDHVRCVGVILAGVGASTAAALW